MEPDEHLLWVVMWYIHIQIKEIHIAGLDIWWPSLEDVTHHTSTEAQYNTCVSYQQYQSHIHTLLTVKGAKKGPEDTS